MVIHPNNNFLPKAVSVELNNTTKLDVVHFDFVSQLLCILQNKNMITKENLLIDIQNPSQMYNPTDGVLREALSGTAYHEIYNKAHANHNGTLPLLVIPICLWGDTTHIDSAGRFKLEPWSFSPLIFNEVARRNHKFWGMLGYVKNLKTTSAQKKLYKKGDTIRMYHKQLISILVSLQSCDDRLKNI